MSSHVLLNDEEHEIEWPTEYHFTGENINFVTTLKTPFEIWASADQNRARIDYYGGVTKKYFNGEENSTYMAVFPMPNSDMEVEINCWNVGDEDLELLPDGSLLSFTGETVSLFDKLVDVWTGTYGDDEDQNVIVEETLYVYKNSNGVQIPVQHIIKKLNEVKGSITAHKVTNYYNFEDTIPEDVLKHDDDVCMFASNFKRDIQYLIPDVPEHLNFAFESFATHHSKEYHEKERQMRKSIFERNWRMVQEHNRKNLSYKMEINEFSDRTPHELKHLTGLLVQNQPSKEAMPFPHTLEEIDDIVNQLPENFDLRFEGAVTPVKNQGSCGSCWAFATTAALEGAFARVNGDRLLDLSEQSIVDCAWNEGNMGCDGGLLETAWQYMLKNGIPTEKEYGIYMEHDGSCHLSNMTTLYKIRGFANVTPRNPNALKVALYKYGPVTIGLQATDAMLSYANGLFYDLSCDPDRPIPNHAVTIVGYGKRHGEDYWIIKNSWGESWGEDGYILILAKNNNCFVLDYPCYPIV
ncbi:unnamed protein product [Arctia plantaginis]|uniref:Uncharacterized protein n=1 Tax=Arctia plantaginis TaxID=874455 RepID=A0A8S0Z9B2_ARCPL|nr:unnamed protein product [Arctia plantaginis]